MRIASIPEELLDAYGFAEEAHRGQLRKYTAEPYITHPLAVAMLVREHGGDLAMQKAAILHDVVEDTERSLDDVHRRYGGEVAELVAWLTKTSRASDGNRAARVAIDLSHTARACPRAKSVKLADITHNASSIARYAGDGYARKYLQEKAAEVDVLRDASLPSLHRLALLTITQSRATLRSGTCSAEKRERMRS